jgi:hypothetical protein
VNCVFGDDKLTAALLDSLAQHAEAALPAALAIAFASPAKRKDAGSEVTTPSP